MTRKGMIIVLSGFSGAGKGTIMKNLLKAHPGQYHLSISATTRQSDQGEEVAGNISLRPGKNSIR